jgi:hypothetical protein
MHQHINPLPQIISNFQRPIQNKKNEIIPIGISQSGPKLVVLAKDWFYHLVVGLSDGVDVGDVQELDFAVCVVLLWFVAFAADLVAQRRHVVPGIVDYAVWGHEGWAASLQF